MQQWLFVAASGQQFSASEPDLPALVQSGQITDQTLMWREGMAQWMPASAVFPTLFAAGGTITQPMAPAAANPVVSPGVGTVTRAAGSAGGGAQSPPEPAAVRRLVRPLYERKGWMKFLAIMTIIFGVLSALYLIGIILIFAGVALLRAVGHIERSQAVGDPGALEDASKEMGKYFFLQGVFMAVYLALAAIAIVVFLLMGATLLTSLRNAKAHSPLSDPSHPERIEDIRFPDSPPPAPR